MPSEAEVAEARVAWSQQFGGGMVPFDDAYWAARDRGETIAEAQRQGVAAVLDAFVAYMNDAQSFRS